MEIDYLREFTVLARQLNYREAAAELHLSQSTLSRHITALEALYGVPLFQRDRHAVHLTDAGVFLLDYAKGIWDQYSLSREHMQRLFAGEHLLRISGVIGHPSLYPCIRDAESLLHDIDPTATLRIERNASAAPGDQIDELDNDGADCALLFSAVDDLEGHDDLACLPLATVPMALIVRRDHPLASAPSIDATMLEGGTFVQLTGPDFSAHWRVFGKLLDRAGIGYTTMPYPANSEYDAIRAADVMGRHLYLTQRYAILPAMAQNPDLVAIPLADERLTPSLDLIYRLGHKEGLARNAASCLAEAFRRFTETH